MILCVLILSLPILLSDVPVFYLQMLITDKSMTSSIEDYMYIYINELVDI